MKFPSLIQNALRAGTLALCAALATVQQVSAQASYTGVPYTQNFDTLASTGSATAFTDNVTLTGWFVENYDTGYGGSGDFAASLLFGGTPGTRQNQSDNYTPGTGSSNGGALYSFGVAGVNAVTERALGAVGSGTPDDFFIGVGVKNDSGAPLVGFTIAYDGEQWRLGGQTAGTPPVPITNRPETVVAFYRVGGTAFDASGTWTAVSALDFISPNITTSAGSALDGNASLNRVAGITATISVPVQAGQIVWVLWADADHSGADHGMAIDNFSFTGVSATVGAPVISSPTSATGNANSLFSYTITASESPTSYNASSLPGWLSVNTSTGVLSGTPPVPGSFPVTVTATNGFGTGAAVVTITVAPDSRAPVVASNQEIIHLINTPLSYTVQASVLAPNQIDSYTIGTLPAGLSFDTATGIISGTPTATATFQNVAVSATNVFGTGSSTITIRLVSPPTYSGDTIVSAPAGATGFTYTLAFGQTPFDVTFDPDSLAATGLQSLTTGVLSGAVTSTPGTYPIPLTATNDYGTLNMTFTLIVVNQATIPQNVLVNKFSNSSPDVVELLVIASGTLGSSVNMRGMILKDFSTDITSDGGGRSVFADTGLWSAVPAGTLVVLSAGNTAVEDLDASDYVLRVNLGNTAYFETVVGIDIATREMVMIKAAGTAPGGVAGGIHALSSGSVTAAQYAAFAGPKLGTTQTTGFGFGVIVNNVNSVLADYLSGTGATGNVALASMPAFGTANNITNQTYINSLRAAALSTNANLSALSLTSATLSPSFSAGTISYTATVANSTSSLTVTPTVEQANASVTVNGVAVVSGNPSASIPLSEGANVITTVVTAQDLTTTKTYTVTVTRLAPALTIWRDGFFSGGNASTATTGPGADAADFDGDGVSNLIEYIGDTDPTLPSANPVVASTVTEGPDTFLTLTYPRRAGDDSLTYTVQASSDLTTGFTTGAGSTVTTGGNSTYTDNVAVDAINSKRFLRLQVSHP